MTKRITVIIKVNVATQCYLVNWRARSQYNKVILCARCSDVLGHRWQKLLPVPEHAP